MKTSMAGCLLGLAIGDSLGAHFEGQSPEAISSRFNSIHDVISRVVSHLYYTDDTQMAIGVAETLSECGQIDEAVLCRQFVANYDPSRGYGMGARVVLEAMELGRDYQAVAANYFPGGSFGNGAAMRVAPVGVFFQHDHGKLLENAERQSLPTHVHPLGIDGARLLALAAALAAEGGDFDRSSFFSTLIESCQTKQFRDRMQLAADTEETKQLLRLGNGIAALESVPTAIACFALSPNDYLATIDNAIFLGGDTDTIAAMAGALSGARLGIGGIPRNLINAMEQTPKSSEYLIKLAEKLADVSCAQ